MLACSYHIFIYSFTFNYSDFGKILENLKKHHWVELNFEEEFKSTLDKEDYFNKYAEFQYFNEQVRSILFHKNDVVKNFELYHNGLRINDGKYVIKKGNDIFELKIKSIKLKLFCTGSGLLIFDLANNHKISMEDINKINEYGRRLSLPFIGVSPHPLVSDSIEILADGEVIASEKFKDTIDKLNDDFLNEKSKVSILSKSEIVSKLLPFEYNTSDDRMFVCCLVRNNDLSDKTCSYLNNDYAYLNDCVNDGKTSSNELYKFAFVETSLSCQNKNMKRRKLEESIYPRWADYGTLFGMTPHSFVCLTREDEFLEYSVINPFINIYTEILCLALVQRDSIALMINEISKMSLAKREDIILMEKRFFDFQRKLLLSKVTMQEQGIELFDLMRERLDILNEYKLLERKMSNIL